MSITGNNLFMLEVIVYRVTLTDQIQIHNTCPVCVCFRFPGLVELVICEGGFCADGKVGGGEILMTNGKSCLLTVSTADLCRTARDFCAIISVNRRALGEQQMRYVAQTKLEFDRTFVDVILNPNQDQRARKLKRVTYTFRVVIIYRLFFITLLIRYHTKRVCINRLPCAHAASVPHFLKKRGNFLKPRYTRLRRMVTLSY